MRKNALTLGQKKPKITLTLRKILIKVTLTLKKIVSLWACKAGWFGNGSLVQRINNSSNQRINESTIQQLLTEETGHCMLGEN